MMNIVITVSDDYAAKVCSTLSAYRDTNISIIQDFRDHSQPIPGCNDSLIWTYDEILAFHEPYNDVGFSGITPDLWVSLHRYIPFFLKQTDRLSFYPLAVEKLLEIFYRYARLWYVTYTEHHIDAVVFFATPHLGFDFVSYAVAEILGIKVRIVNRTGLSLRSVISYSIDLWNQGTSYAIASNTSSDGLIDSSCYKSDVSLSHSIPINKSVQAQHSINHISIRSLISPIATFKTKILKYLINSTPKKETQRESFRWLSGPRDGLQLAYERLLHARRTRNLLKCYLNYCTDHLPAFPYIYYAAHFQPERSTAPEGGCFDNQLLAIDSLLDCLPRDIHIVYKEHPRQFDVKDLRRKHSRSSDYYLAIRSRPKVHLLDPFHDSCSLISGSVAVATVSGTSGWEAIKAGKPCVIFGDAWYKTCDACLHVSELNPLSLSNLIDMPPDRVQVALFRFLEWASRTFVQAPNTDHMLNLCGASHSLDTYSSNLSQALHESLSIQAICR